MKDGQTHAFPAAFMRQDVEELERFPNEETMRIKLDFVRRQSPDSLSVMELKSPIELRIAEKMLTFPKLGGPEWGIKLSTEFHMTNDSYLFRSSPGPGRLPLYEGKMMHQFTHQWSAGRYFVDEAEARHSLIRKGVDDEGQVLDYQQYCLGYRDIASSTNERSLIATILPKFTFKGNKVPIVTTKMASLDLLYLCGVLNSYCTDWHVRQRITSTLNFFYLYQTPAPLRLENVKVSNIAARLICTTSEYADLWQEVEGTTWSLDQVATKETERNQLRAQLDAQVAKLYGLTEEEFVYILSTFPIVDKDQKLATINAFRDLANNKVNL
jgi:hypothetical protein